MSFVCLDAGNTRLKWGVADARRAWLAQGALEWSALDTLPSLLADAVHEGRGSLRHAFLSSVVAPDMEQALVESLSGLPMTRLAGNPGVAGVENGYADPVELGVDRWCALIGARAQERRACLVVMAGTATTIDSLDEAGRFLGGLILPSVELMKNALHQGTARLPLAEGRYVAHPDNTRDAIVTGCLDAQLGAIERAYARLLGAQICLLSGGAAFALEPLLDLPARVVPNLVLEGMRHWAFETMNHWQ